MQPEDNDQLQLLQQEWNDTATDYPEDTCTQLLFEQQAREHPDAIAIVDGDNSLTYAALDQQANQLANHLLTLGVTQGTSVALCLERSAGLIVALIAILKAGGVYVPLDPAYPRSRRAYMLKDTDVSVLLVHASLQHDVPVDFQGRVVSLDGGDASAIAAQSDVAPSVNVAAGQPAYILYTSGSTGVPKGVEVPHRAINRLVRDTNYIKILPGDRITHLSNISFDAATFEIWGSLLNGACLVVVSGEQLLSPVELGKILTQQGVTIMFLTTVLFNQMVEAIPEKLGALEYLLFGGEASDPARVRQLLSRSPPRQLLHVYGPTECTTFATWFRVEQLPENAVTVPIGRPLANTTAFVLDEQRQPVAVETAGELYLGGAGLALGYHNRPDLTSERFIQNPFGPEGERLYRTGDLVCYRRDGNIEFLGRIDDQVKLRGFRVEPGEIVNALRRLPGVQQAVVTLYEDSTRGKQLIAHVAGEEIDPAAIKTALKTSLPEYMIPAGIIALSRLPLTPNGKVDRAALPAPDWGRVSLGKSFEPPRTEEEKLLAGIYAEVLGVDNASIHDSFHELGGHSLTASRLVARVRDLCKIELPFRSVFEKPLLSDLAAEIRERRRGVHASDVFAVPPVQPGESLPLSCSQERVWFLTQLDQSIRAYNFQGKIHLHGNLDVDALEHSLGEIVRRHESLRTTFPDENGEPLQLVHEAQPVVLPLHDFTSLDAVQRDEEVRRLLQSEMQTPFDVTRLPLVRWTLIRQAKDDHILVHVDHHLIHDGWSFNVFLDELQTLYLAFCEGRPSPLLELPMQFTEFARWQRCWLQTDEASRQLDYWKDTLAGCKPLLELPYDRPRPVVQRFRGAAPRFRLPASLVDKMEQRCRQEGVTPYMMLLTALFVLLYRYSGQEDICVGSGMANRRWKQAEGLIGMTINNVVLRASLSGKPGVRALLKQVREIVLGAAANQDMPFDKVVDALEPERSLGYNPLFQVLFGIHDAPVSERTLPDLEGFLDVGLANSGAKFDITVVAIPGSAQRLGPLAQPGPEPMTVIWEYNTDLFDEATAGRMMRHYQTLLESMIAVPERAVTELPLLTDSERRQLLKDWNQTQTAFPHGKTVTELFEEQVADSPGAVALELGDEQLSYRELNTRANRLAHYLQARGVGPEVMVAICMDRSIEMIVGLLGILKAGGAYVPLAPDYPQTRLAFMLEDTGAPLLLTQSSLRAILPAFRGEIIQLDADWPAIEQESGNNPAPAATRASLMYVIYTSGSTGRPKGVCVEHHSVVRLVKNTNYVELGPGEVLLQFAPVSFDASTFELWGSLLNGAKLVVFPAEWSSLKQLGQVIKDSGVTTLWLTSALFSQMVDQQLPSLAGVRQLLAGGETLSVPHVRKVLAQLGDHRLVNGYGPTENTTFTCCHVMTADSRIGESVPIGRPINNTTVYILDAQMNPVPVGVYGELYTGGEGVARGYLNRPELTAERFVDDPFSDVPGARLYNTGDVARYRADGTIEFMGRKDRQVKIRGFRTEPGEIETALQGMPEVSQVAVIVQEDQPGDKRLVAYLTMAGAALPDTSGLRAQLSECLPGYMIPATFVVLPEMPLTANGKIDRESLQPPGVSENMTAVETVERFSKTEELVADVWRDLLRVSDRVGLHANFFQSGGHSLLATQLVNQLDERFGLDIPLRTVFEFPTVAGMSAYIDDLLLQELEGKPYADNVSSPDPEEMPDCETLPPQAPGEYLGEDESFEGFSKTEQLVAGIWCDLLKLDRIGLHDNFFASGGHSLLAMQLVNQFDVHFGLDVSLRTVFECPTVTGLSAYIDDLLLQEIEPSPVLGDEE